jgi:predicted kinase
MSKPAIYIFFGLIASGKSTLSEMFAGRHGFPWYNTDRVRKDLAGIAANERRPDGMNKGIYTMEFTAKTYNSMLEQAKEDIDQGAAGVVLDGSYSRREDRCSVLDLAMRLNAIIFFILCKCSDDVVQERLARRAKDPEAVSDGRWEIFVRQKESFEFPAELDGHQLLELDTEDSPDKLIARVEQFCAKHP